MDIGGGGGIILPTTKSERYVEFVSFSEPWPPVGNTSNLGEPCMEGAREVNALLSGLLPELPLG